MAESGLKKSPKVTIYSAELDLWFTPEVIGPNQYAIDYELPPNSTDSSIAYTFELYVNDEPSGMFADVVIQPKQTTAGKFVVAFMLDAPPYNLSIPKVRLIHFGFTIAGWKVDSEERFYAEITDSFLRETDHIDLWFDDTSLETVMACKFSTRCEVSNGSIRFYTDAVPDKPISGRILLLGEGIGSEVVINEFNYDTLTREDIDSIFDD